jgi:cellulose synthase/poly-beta-1,6-N-acetylglucosamine synthase-like glycosyltransferase
MIRLMESRLGVTLSGSGAIYAVRRQCFVPLSADTLVEDLIVPMNARALGYGVLYDPEAKATDFAASTVAGEFTRRVRIATGSFQVLGRLLRAPLDARTKFAFLSHKALRWIIPFLLIGMLVTSASLWQSPFYRALFFGQLVFYGWGALGYLLRARVQRVRYMLLGYYLVAMHLAFLVGFVHFLLRHNEAGWRRVN